MIERQLAQLTPHRGVRIDLPSRYGQLAALRAPAHSTDHGVTVLFVPGYTGSKENFAPLIDPVSDQGFEVIALDLPGQYESAGPDSSTAYRPAALGSVLADVMGKLAADGRRIFLVGHSYGGLVARGAVLAGAPISGLTLLDAGPAELPAGPRRAALDLGETILREQGIQAACTAWETQFTDWTGISPQLKEFRRTQFLSSAVPGLLGMADGLRYEPDLVAKLRTALRLSSMPCLVVCGAHDDAWPVATQRDMADRLDVDFAVVDDARHNPNVENPDGLLAILLPTWRAWLAE